MFFFLSKTLWFFVDPGNLLLMGLLLGLLLMGWKRLRSVGQGLIAFCAFTAVLVAFVPIGNWMIGALENRFNKPALDRQVDGIVVLGGVVSPVLSDAHGTPSFGGAVERITASAALARAFPEARVLYTGGSGSVMQTELREADYVAELYADLGIDKRRLTLDRDARNTAENASIGYRLMQPSQDETWVLVTSAFHMPRAVGVFRRVGWSVIPYPVDFSTVPNAGFSSPMSLTGGLGKLSQGLREWIGLTAYWLTGRTTTLFPRPLPLETT